MHDQQARIPHPSNPYVDHSDQYVRVDVPEPPVLTLRDLERMVKARLDVERTDAATRQRMACHEAWERGREFGVRDGYQRAKDNIYRAVEEVANRHLNHDVRRLADRAERQRTTIKAEREFIADAHRYLKRSVEALWEAMNGA